MSSLTPELAAMHPRCDGRRVLFEMVNEEHSVPCAISLGALEDVSERRCFRPAEQLSAFVAARWQIEAVALSKIRAQAQDASGLVYIWSNDIEDALAASEAVAGRPV